MRRPPNGFYTKITKVPKARRSAESSPSRRSSLAKCASWERARKGADSADSPFERNYPKNRGREGRALSVESIKTLQAPFAAAIFRIFVTFETSASSCQGRSVLYGAKGRALQNLCRMRSRPDPLMDWRFPAEPVRFRVGLFQGAWERRLEALESSTSEPSCGSSSTSVCADTGDLIDRCRVAPALSSNEELPGALRSWFWNEAARALLTQYP